MCFRRDIKYCAGKCFSTDAPGGYERTIVATEMETDQAKAVELNGEGLALDATGALWWAAERTLVFADLHFEKGSSFARGGQLLPPYDTRSTLARISALARHYAPERIIALGDSFHDRDAANRLDENERAVLRELGDKAEWIWIEGNHDPQPPKWLGGFITSEIAIGGLIFRHLPSPHPARGEIAGHLHPCAKVTRRGRSVRARCFASDGHRMVLPAFGAYAGGLDVRERVLRALFADNFLAYVLGRAGVYAVAA
jgi:DNA ligase-associated metallophosphoesterase